MITDRMWARLLSSTNQPSFVHPRDIMAMKTKEGKSVFKDVSGEKREGKLDSKDATGENRKEGKLDSKVVIGEEREERKEHPKSNEERKEKRTSSNGETHPEAATK